MKPATVIELCASHGNVILGSRRQQLFIDLPRLQSRFVCFIVFIFFLYSYTRGAALKKGMFSNICAYSFQLEKDQQFYLPFGQRPVKILLLVESWHKN